MVYPLDVFGYHGTTVAAARSILRDGFRPSTKRSDWLGRGIYFWQDAPLRAWEWAERQAFAAGPGSSVPGAAEPAVLRAMIRLSDCLDLLDVGWNDALIGAYRSFADRGISPPAQVVMAGAAREDIHFLSSAHRLDCAVVNIAVEVTSLVGRPIRAVRGVFLEGSPLFPGSALYDRAHVQIAVRDAALFLGEPVLVDRAGNDQR